MEQTVSVKKDAKREIISLALLLEDVSSYGVHISYSAHVSRLEVWVSETKEDFKNKIFEQSFYTDFAYETEKKYQEIKSFLQSKIEEYIGI